jgi:hypothetical protein
MPDDGQIDDLEATQKWRIAYGFVPIGMYVFTIFALLTVFTYDSVKFCIVKGNVVEARKHIGALYKYANTP